MNTATTRQSNARAINTPPPSPAFIRRRNHANIEAMSGLILQAIGYPSTRLRDFICAVQSAHGAGKDAEEPFTPFIRAHLSLARFLEVSGTDESKVQTVSRTIRRHDRWQRQKGVTIITVIPPTEEGGGARLDHLPAETRKQLLAMIPNEKTIYLDWITPLADEAMQQALGSPLWKTDKPGALAQAVLWAVSQLPHHEPEPEDTSEDLMPLSDYTKLQLDRLIASAEKIAEQIETRYYSPQEASRFLLDLSRKLARSAVSLDKTRRARFAMVEEPEEGPPPPPSAGRVITELPTGQDPGGVADGERGGGINTMVADPATPPPAPAPEAEGLTKVSTPLTNNLPDFSSLTERGVDKSVNPPVESAPAEVEIVTDLVAVPLGLAHALMNAREGFPVVANWWIRGEACACPDGPRCQSAGKHPLYDRELLPNGIRSATRDADLVHRWWLKWPQANLGLAMGRECGAIALDFDWGKGGCEAYMQFRVEGLLPQETREAQTGGGGRHVLVAYEELGLLNAVSVRPGLDLRTNGGQIIVEPSRHKSGGRYQWITDWPVASMPAALRELLVASATQGAVRESRPSDGGVADREGAWVEGERNHELFNYGCWLRGQGHDSWTIERELTDRNRERCRPPLGAAEVRKIARSAAKYPSGGRQ